MSFSRTQLTQNFVGVGDRIKRAAERNDRDPSSVQLVVVTKYVDVEVIQELIQLGCRDFGESRPQVFWEKTDQISDESIRWHFIGHLQTNKVKRTLPQVDLLHAGDSLKLLKKVSDESTDLGRVTDVLAEFNVSGDQAKHGFSPDEASTVIAQILEFPGVRFRGLMAMASREGGVQRAESDFRRLAELRQEILGQDLTLDGSLELSMGMSGDFEQAIECGATIVRVGSVLFEGI